MAPQVSWNSLDNGYGTTQFYSVAIDHLPGSNLIVGGLQDNGTWRTSTGNAQTPWTLSGTGDGSYCQVADGGRTLYVSKQEGKAYRVMLDENGNMTAETRIDPFGGGKYLFINPFALDPADQKIMYLAGGGYVWRNGDLTAIPLGSTSPTPVNWARLDAAHPADTSRVTALGVSSAAPSHRLYVGTDFGTLYRIDNADAGDPAAANVTAASFPKKAYVSCIAVDPLDGDRAIVVFSNYNVVSLFATTDAGETWSAVAGNLEQNPSGSGNGPSCRWASILHRGAGTIYLVGTSTGLYSSVKLDSMKTTWSLEGASTIGNTIVDMIDVRQADGFVAIGTHGSGVFSTTIATLGVGGSQAEAGTSALLEGNYPNPVTASTTIPFNVPASASATLPVRLALYDPQGRELSVLVDERRRPGHYTAVLNLASLDRAIPNGTVFYRLQVGDATQTRAMQVMR
jgi:hypothetical protein